MRISTEINGPSLAEVLAFTIVETADDVARVERAAGNRMAAVRGWSGWRVDAVDISEEADGLARLKIYAKPIGPCLVEAVIHEFLVGLDHCRRSKRFDAFLLACGVTKLLGDSSEIEGRYFATRNRGRGSVDFGPLTNALPQ